MKSALLIVLCWNNIRLSASLPVEDKPGFTPWPLARRLIPASEFSGPLGPQFGVDDEECRGRLKGDIGKCWRMTEATVDKFLANRAPKTKECNVPCLFYTSFLSGAAEREANFVLRQALLTSATEGPRKYQTIWDLHDQKYYPNPDRPEETPESICIYRDYFPNDIKVHFDGCQRLYFKAMSKAMVMECSGEVFVMTNANLRKPDPVTEDGIWWQVEFPTLIDGNRAPEKKVTKITYLQVPFLEKEKMAALSPEDKSKPPEILHQAEYWPNGPGAEHLKESKNRGASKRTLVNTAQGPSSAVDVTVLTMDQPIEYNDNRLVQRANGERDEVLELGDDGYPYAYSIDDIYNWYKDATW